jgi:hypothetical protein
VARPDIPVFILPFGEGQPAAARAELDADFAALVESEIGGMNSRVAERLARGGERERNGARNVLAVFRIELGLPVEIPNLCGYLDGRIRNVEALDQSDAALSLLQRAPESLAPRPDGSHTTHPGNHDATRAIDASQHNESDSLTSSGPRLS